MLNINEVAKPVVYEVSSSPSILIKSTNAGGILKWYGTKKADKNWKVECLTAEGWKAHNLPIFLDSPEEVYALVSKHMAD